ncbi:MAG: hypothetical protein IKJ16_07140 [Agathobacter sp.]|nr:hypothetical protein [Agathobacter sp.]
MRQEKGSITIFSLLSLLIITAGLFALLEGTRLQEMRRFAKLQTTTALESAFANYNDYLWQNYHILGTNLTQMNPILERCASGREGDGLNLLRMNPEEITLKSYTFLTDGGGRVFIKSVAAYMQDNLIFETAKELYNQYEASKSIMNSNEVDIENIEAALEEIKNIEASEEKKMTKTQDATRVKETQPEEILETAKTWGNKGILDLLLEDSGEVSTLRADFSNGLLERELEKGRFEDKPQVDWRDRLLLQQYYLTTMSNFRESKSQCALSYELEYLLGQKDSDIENLKVVANKLLALREATNFLYLISNPQKTLEANELAILLAGASANPAIIEVVKLGILTAWAFGESILDVRGILAGKKIALLKSEDTWTTDFKDLDALGANFVMAKEAPTGLSYEQYLGLLLLFEKDESLAMRAMNLQEAAIRKNTFVPSFRMDTLVTQVKMCTRYSYEVIFPFLRVIDAQKRWEYEVYADENYGYY